MDEQIASLIEFYRNHVKNYQSQGFKVMASSSFQSHSIPMLKILAEIDATIPIFFLNTGFHFPETIKYKNQIAALYGLNVVDLFSPIPKAQQVTHDGQLLFASVPDYCCYVNKTLPMEPKLAEYDVWITGVRRDQNENRKKMTYEADGKYGIKRFHPMLDWTQDLIDLYIKTENIPLHPLESIGYYSVGCEPCTQKPKGLAASTDRTGRWNGLKKNECGLHTELLNK